MAGAQPRRHGWEVGGQIRCQKVLSTIPHGLNFTPEVPGDLGGICSTLCHELIYSLGGPLYLNGKTDREGSTIRDMELEKKWLLCYRPGDDTERGNQEKAVLMGTRECG